MESKKENSANLGKTENVKPKEQIFLIKKRKQIKKTQTHKTGYHFKPYKKQPNGLYTTYELSEDDKKSKLYLDYIKINNAPDRFTFLNAQFRIYENNKQKFPTWAKNERDFLSKKKSEINKTYFDTDGGKRARKRSNDNNNPQNNKKSSDARKNRLTPNADEARLLKVLSQYSETYYQKGKKFIQSIAFGNWKSLTDKNLATALAAIRRYLYKEKGLKSDLQTCHELRLDKELKQIAKEKNVKKFRDYLESRDQQALDNFNRLINLKDIGDRFNQILPLGENEVDEKEEYLNVNMPENNQENGEEKSVTEPEKTLNWYGMTTFKQDENQLKDTFFNLDNTYGNNIDGQGF